MSESKTTCHINIREWENQKGLGQSKLEVNSIDELYQKILESSKNKNVHSVSIEQMDNSGERHTVLLEISNIIHEKVRS